LNTVQTLRQALARASGGENAGFDALAYRQRLTEALDDDLNTPQALAVLFDLSKDLNTRLAAAGGMSVDSLIAADALFRDFGTQVLGIVPDQPLVSAGGGSEEGLMELFIALRKEARATKNFSLSDRIRDGLKELGIVLEDRKDGTGWKRS
jgi:cysteinyl-tRNA synthetase